MPGPDPTSSIAPDRILGGRYRLVAPIARGGMAEVWEGHDEVLSRPVAVKLLQAHLASDGVFLERFRREAVTAARLAHPCVVSMYDTGVDEGTAYIVMELVRGDTLRRLVSDGGALDARLAVAITKQIADALAEAHQAGLVHRDIKPANVLLVDDGWGGVRVKVTDFGIAKASEGIGADLTRTGTVLGTPKYLSPEQIRGDEPDSRADLYALGVVLFEMLTGDPPYSGATDMATALAHLNDALPTMPLRAHRVPTDLQSIVTGLLAKDPSNRIPSATVLRRRLDELGSLPGGGTPRPVGVASDASASSRARLDEVSARTRPGTRTVAKPLEETSEIEGTIAVPLPNGVDAPSGGRGGSVAENGPGRTPGDGTVALRPDGPSTDPFGKGQVARKRRRTSSTTRRVGALVAGLVVVGAITAAAVLAGPASRHHTPSPAQAGPASGGPQISRVSVFMTTTARTPDNPSMTRFTFDGDPSTYWPTDQYSSPTFGNLYPGIGLAIELNGSEQGRHLVVTSPTSGWSAQTYVSSADVPFGRPVSDWGPSTDAKSGIPSGTVTFQLGGRRAQWVLLWITNLGPSDAARIAELSIR